METSQSVVELVAAAQTKAKPIEDRVAELVQPTSGQNGTQARMAELSDAISALEAAAVDIFTLFEARMQHHFKRGPFSRKLKAQLLAADKTDLADRFHQYYLAINVLKHGKGASYRELLASPPTLFSLKTADALASEEAQETARLIDISAPGFFDGLTTTILDAYRFLEKA
ncbi:hypothetical protein [Celeribacter sp.]|uniref:hypothetical protein n=1 Tax=Celeribacter sp. TaxID=1890673 RepID=UPI003A946C54